MTSASGNPKETSANREILNFIERYGVRDKDAAPIDGPHARKKAIDRDRKGLFRKILDLHGMTSEEAEVALFRGFETCKKNGIKKMLIIHGKGLHSGVSEGGVLKNLVRGNLEGRYNSLVRHYAPALPRDGGEGATLAILK
jgi:DNA-nicking Smr family endonuclease